MAVISIEFIWKAKSAYWGGQVRVVDLYVDGKKRYSVHIPEEDNKEGQEVSLPFIREMILGKSGSFNYLTFNKVDTLQKISLRAGIFHEKKGNTMIMGPDGRSERETYMKREDCNIELAVNQMQVGNHYKIVMSHSMAPENPGSPFWVGDFLQTTIQEAGPCKQEITQTPQTSSHSNGSASTATYAPARDLLAEQHRLVMLTFKNMFSGVFMVKTAELLLKTTELDDDPHNVTCHATQAHIIEQGYIEMMSQMESKLIAELFGCCQSGDEMAFLNKFLDANGENRLKTLSLNIFRKMSPGAPDNLITPIANRIVQMVTERKGLTLAQTGALTLRNLQKKMENSLN